MQIPPETDNPRLTRELLVAALAALQEAEALLIYREQIRALRDFSV